MKSLLTLRCTLATSVLLGVALGAGAQALGTIQAEAWIGRPLEASLPASFEDGSDPCVHADVSYGDTRIPASEVRTTVQGTGAARQVRVQTNVPIDEPVVTVAVRAGCRNSVTRSYTLLPNYPTAPMLADAGPPGRRAQAAGTLSVVLAAQAAGAPPKILKAPRAAQPPRATQVAAADVPEAPPKRPRSIVKVRQPLADGGARLRLESWEPDSHAMLRVTASMAPPQEAGRATAALLWQALNASPEQLLRTTATLQQLEGELAQLRQAAGQTHSEVLALRRQIEAPQPVSLSTQGVQLLALLLALAAGTLGILWWRTARYGGAGEWSGQPLASVFGGLQAEPDAAQPAPQMQERSQAQPLQAAQPAAVPVPRLAQAQARGAVQSTALPAAVPVRARTMQSSNATLLRVETLAATFEEVDFLTSLGLWNDAMDVLKTYLEDSAAPAPLAYYELMRLCVHVDDAASLVAVRKRYAQVFGVDAPRFEQINAPRGIDSYPELSGRVTAAWGTHEAPDFIELTLFTVTPPGKSYSLQAGRDLLFLHDLALAELGDSGSAAADADGHALAPWALGADPRLEMPDATGGHRFGLDLDLDLGIDGDELRESQPIPPELPRRATVARREPQPPESAPASLGEHDDAFSVAVATERMRRA